MYRRYRLGNRTQLHRLRASPAGATSLMFEGIPTYPNAGRFWDIVDKHQVNIIYTAPTAIRALMREGEHWVTGHDLSSLKLLGTVGEPINPEAWMWYYTYVGKEKLPIVDTWWQTETGGILITPLPGAMTKIYILSMIGWKSAKAP